MKSSEGVALVVCPTKQGELIPMYLGEWVPEDHLARLISDISDQLDLSAITEGIFPLWRSGVSSCYVVEAVVLRLRLAYSHRAKFV